eukprot:scaffold112213_cov87-Phaeocystis_antarctica.AAC.1
MRAGEPQHRGKCGQRQERSVQAGYDDRRNARRPCRTAAVPHRPLQRAHHSNFPATGRLRSG